MLITLSLQEPISVRIFQKELLEAAEMDGCSDFRFFSQIVVPLSAPIIAVLSLWVAVSLWNSYFWFNDLYEFRGKISVTVDSP